jgi:hypothetical protein
VFLAVVLLHYGVCCCVCKAGGEDPQCPLDLCTQQQVSYFNPIITASIVCCPPIPSPAPLPDTHHAHPRSHLA